MVDLTDEFTNGPLAAELAPLIAASDFVGILNVLNRKDIAVLGKLTVHDVKQYISLLGLRLPILDSTATSCREFNMALEDFKESGFSLDIPMINQKIVAVLDALVAEVMIPDFTEEHKLTLLSLGNKLISRAEQLGITITFTDVLTSILNDDGTRKI